MVDKRIRYQEHNYNTALFVFQHVSTTTVPLKQQD